MSLSFNFLVSFFFNMLVWEFLLAFWMWIKFFMLCWVFVFLFFVVLFRVATNSRTVCSMREVSYIVMFPDLLLALRGSDIENIKLWRVSGGFLLQTRFKVSKKTRLSSSQLWSRKVYTFFYIVGKYTIFLGCIHTHHVWFALDKPEFVSSFGPDVLCQCEYTWGNHGVNSKLQDIPGVITPIISWTIAIYVECGFPLSGKFFMDIAGKEAILKAMSDFSAVKEVYHLITFPMFCFF